MCFEQRALCDPLTTEVTSGPRGSKLLARMCVAAADPQSRDHLRVHSARLPLAHVRWAWFPRLAHAEAGLATCRARLASAPGAGRDRCRHPADETPHHGPAQLSTAHHLARAEPWTMQHLRTRGTTARHAFRMFPKPVQDRLPAGWWSSAPALNNCGMPTDCRQDASSRRSTARHSPAPTPPRNLDCTKKQAELRIRVVSWASKQPAAAASAGRTAISSHLRGAARGHQ